MHFCYAISFGSPLRRTLGPGFDAITSKFEAFFERGCRAFGVLFDDLVPNFARALDKSELQQTADIHADACNRLFERVISIDRTCTLIMCPSEYHGRPPFSAYLHRLGETLDPAIDVFYTGPDVCSAAITSADAAAFGEAIARRPVIWDNYPTNDLFMKAEMHLGPLRERDPMLNRAARGFVANLMNQKEASKIALLTIADYMRDPDAYLPDESWNRALCSVAGKENCAALARFAENTLCSCLYEHDAPKMDAMTSEALAALRLGRTVAGSRQVADLQGYLDVIDESCYQLKNRMRNLALRRDLLPWIEALEGKVWIGRFALRLLQAIEEGADFTEALRTMEGLLADVRQSGRRIGGTQLFALAEYARRRARAAGRISSRRRAPPQVPGPSSHRAGDGPMRVADSEPANRVPGVAGSGE